MTARHTRGRAAPRLAALSLTAALAAAVPTLPADAAPAPAPAPAATPLAGGITTGSPHDVGWDDQSLTIDGRRVFLWSGEIHPFRTPSPSLWRDVLQKMRSNGYDAVSIYVDWGMESPEQGVYDWTGVRDLDRFLDIAEEVGLYVIARPGPYINAEVDGGGFPGWLKNISGKARTDAADYLAATDEYQSEVDAILARHQLTDGGGSVVLYQVENEYASNINSDPAKSTPGSRYMAHLYDKARADGITVPIFHNDKGRNGYWRPGDFPTPASEQPADYLYGFDGYPAGTCSTSGNPGTPGAPPDWGDFGPGGRTGGATASPTTPGLLAEFGGGWFDPWGDQLWGGAGYPCMRERQDAAMERQYYLTNVANGIKIHNVYMTYGGTSWGWLPAPIVYTSYDYGAAIDEGRQQTSKLAPMKEIGYFLQSVPSIDATVPAATVPATTDGAPTAGVKSYHVVNPDDGTHFTFFRSDADATDARFTYPVETPDGSYQVPQAGTMRLQGVDMRVLLSDYQLDSTHLVYSTSELMTHQADLDGSDLALFHTRDGQDGETVLRYTTEPAVQTVSGPAPAVTWDAARGDLRLDYTGEGLSEVRITPQGGGRPLTLLLAAESVARTFWRLDTAQGPVIARGPQLLRTASIDQGTAVLTGDTTDATDLQVWAPAGVHKVTWNGDTVADGHLAGTQAPALPALTTWRVQAETPEAQPGFDDSDWVVADHTTSASTTKLPAGQTTVLYADDYGFHHGDVWYRGRYTGADAATGVTLKYQTGQVGQLSAWLDGRYLGSDQVPTPTSKESTTQTWARTASFAVPADLRDGQEHVLSVLARPMASEEDGGANDAFKSARGLTAATLTGDAGALTTPVTWKLQGAQGGEHLTDTVRGPLNNGGLYGERAGWSLPGYPDASWTTTTLPAAPSAPGVTWYRTDVDLKVKPFLDASLGLTLTDDPGKHYRALVFVNGWNLGQYANDVGPQHTFVLPNGVLDPRGHNTVALAVTSTDGSGPGNVSLTDLGTVRGGTPLELVDSPAYAAPTVSATAPAVTGRTVDGPLASVTVPADALGTRFAATVDWGDGTSSDALVSGTGATRTVSGDHGYAKAGRYAVTVQLRDAYGSPLGSDRTTVRAG